MPTVLEKTQKLVAFRKFAAAIKAADLEEELRSNQPITLFVPTDDAFDQIPQWAMERILEPESKGQLVETLRYHLVKGRIHTEDVLKMTRVETMQGQAIKVDFQDGLRVDGAKILKGDIVCDNGIIHVIDRVIPPQ